MEQFCSVGEGALYSAGGEIATCVTKSSLVCSACLDADTRLAMNKAFRSIQAIPDRAKRLRAYLGWASGACIMKIKPAVLLRVSRTVPNLLDAWNTGGEAACAELGLCVQVVCQGPKGKLLLIYNKRVLSRHIEKRVHADFLAARGYPSGVGSEACVRYLSERFRIFKEKGRDGRFPHEVGVFLGYPLADVISFIHNKAASCPCVGYWKAWTKPEKARRSFRHIDNARLSVYANSLTKRGV
jgi:hypothetical protein